MRRYKHIAFSDEQKYIMMLCELTKTDYFYSSTYDSFISLVRVMNKFPKFVYDLSELFYHKIISYENNSFKWKYDNSSLAMYFKSMEKNSGDFWKDIEEAFQIKEGTLRHLASSNGRGIYKPSKDYEKILSLFPNEEEEKYIEKIKAIEEIVDNFWINDTANTKFIDFCEAKFTEIKKIIDG